MKKILVLDGHPSESSFVTALCNEYGNAAQAAEFEVRRINIRDLKFDPNLKFGYTKIQELEPDLFESQQLVKWCDHLVFAYPMWWGNLPATTKGFFDRSWLPGFAFKYHDTDPFWDKLLAGRSARLIVTSDAPTLFNVFVYFNSPYTSVKKMIFSFCGFKPVKITAIGGIKKLSEQSRKKWLTRVKNLGATGS